ncbi:MAG: hypothetical protein E7580_02970 [Ruminococcaceae bacterium]|nr:hypothetical protein [Oscillospiraceae bacterium]
MDKKNSTKKSFFSTKKFKYGAAATVFTALFIAAVILLNAIVSAVDSKYSLHFDMTKDQLFSISDETVTLVNERIKEYEKKFGEKPEIKISFLNARDRIVENVQHSWAVTLAESYAERFSEITVEYNEDLTTHPDKYLKYSNQNYAIDSTAIIFTTQEGAFHVTGLDACLVYNETGEYVWAFQGEMKFNAALIDITTSEKPVVSFTTNHGESIPERLVELVKNCGFDIQEVDLSKTGSVIPPETKILIMCDPQTDIIAVNDDTVESEYTKISDYLNDYRSMIVIGNNTTKSLPVLDELLSDWGLELQRNQLVMDDMYCHVQNNKNLYVEYPEIPAPAAALTKSLTDLTNTPRTISPNSAPIRILKESDASKDYWVEPILTSSVNSYVEIVSDAGVDKKTGSYNLMALSTRKTIENNVDVYGHLLLIGSTDFVSTNAFSEQFGNTKILYNVVRLLADEDIPMNTHYKVLQDYDLNTVIDSGTVYMYGIVSVVLIPLVIFSFGAVVYFKRKHK